MHFGLWVGFGGLVGSGGYVVYVGYLFGGVFLDYDSVWWFG